MKMETLKLWTTRLLLGFVLVSIGFALGKDVTLRRLRSSQPVASASLQTGSRVHAYYMHGAIRCVTCNLIERTAKQLLVTEFAADLATGRITWREVNFEQEPDLAKRYDVAASTLVLAKEVDGKETIFRRLDDVWTLAETPADLTAYIRKNVKELLP